jgi:NAD(P)H-dependent FMN reductase
MIAIIPDSTRPGRRGEAVADRVPGLTKQRGDAEYEPVDIADDNLPHLDEAMQPSIGRYSQPKSRHGRRRSFQSRAGFSRSPWTDAPSRSSAGAGNSRRT